MVRNFLVVVYQQRELLNLFTFYQRNSSRASETAFFPALEVTLSTHTETKSVFRRRCRRCSTRGRKLFQSKQYILY